MSDGNATIIGSADGGEPADTLVGPRAVLGIALACAGISVLAWVLWLVYSFSAKGWVPAVMQRMESSFATATPDQGAEVAAVLHLGGAFVALAAFAVMASIGGILLRCGAGLLQPDWRHVARRFEASLLALRGQR